MRTTESRQTTINVLFPQSSRCSCAYRGSLRPTRQEMQGRHPEWAVRLRRDRFHAAPRDAPGTPWVPKAILEVLHFNGDGTLTTPGVTVANPFGDLGNVAQPPSGAPGLYVINEDCSGTVQFLDANNVTYKIFVDPPQGHTIWMIQTNPANNVFQGSAKRVW